MIQPSLFASLRRILFTALLLPLAAASAPLPVSQLYEPPALAIPKVSPDGKRVALRAEIDGAQYLALLDTASMQIELAAKFETSGLHNIFWKDDNQLLLIVGNREKTRSEFRAFDLRTKKAVFISDNLVFESAEFLSPLPGQPDDVLLEVNSANGRSVARLNIRTGKVKVVEKPNALVGGWMADAAGNPTAAIARDDTTRYLQWRPTPSSPWQRKELEPVKESQINPLSLLPNKKQSSRAPRLKSASIYPFALFPDQKRILAWDLSGPGPVRVVTIDPVTMERETVFAHEYADVEIGTQRYWGSDPSDIFAFHYADDRLRMHFISPVAAQISTALDKALPGAFNDILSTSFDRKVFVIQSSNERNPGAYYLFDLHSGRLAAFGNVYAEVRPEEMGTARHFSLPTDDGLTLRGRLLVPPGNPAKPPLLVMIGPRLNDGMDVGFSSIEQIYATRGYAVLRLNYRGAGAYWRGRTKIFDEQLGTGILRDINASIDYLVAQGWVDGDRVGLVTSGFGAFIGMPLLVNSNRFKVWINDRNLLSDLAQSSGTDLSDETDDKADVDPASLDAAKAYLQTLRAKAMLPQITTPSFHLYQERGSRSLGGDAEAVSDLIKTPRGNLEIVGFDAPPNEKPAHAAELKAREKVFGFLRRHLGSTSANP